jgi:RNA polymerase primary sigma factor
MTRVSATWNDLHNDLGTPTADQEDTAVDSIRVYLNEIGHVPLLSQEEEFRLAECIVRGKLERLKAGENANSYLLAEAEVARRRFIEANLRLVVSIAKKYAGLGVSLQDLIQEGNIGLIRAVEKFDPALGCKFSTYATWWVRQTMMRAIAQQSRIIRLPAYLIERIQHLMRISGRLQQELGRRPTPEEIGQEMGIAVEHVHEIIVYSQAPESLDTFINEEESSSLSDFIEDPTLPQAADDIDHQFLKEQMEALLTHLTERECRVLHLRYGLHDHRRRTLEEVGEELGVTRERIRQIELKALQKLRKQSQEWNLKDYLQ